MLELFIMAAILALFSAGTLRIHAAFHRRFEKIVRERNEAIRFARTEAP